MRKFIVNVNGKSYEVEVEEMQNVSQQNLTMKETATAPVSAPTPTPAPAPATSAPAGGTKVSAPMPGTIKKVAIKNGDIIKKNDVIFVLEAMKLENELYAPCDGRITFVGTSEGSTVNSGDLLCTIE